MSNEIKALNLVPMVVEQTSRGERAYDIYSRLLKERVKPEMHQSVIEVGTGICKDISEVRRDVIELRTAPQGHDGLDATSGGGVHCRWHHSRLSRCDFHARH